MKNLTVYSLLLLLITISFSCVKEKDLTTENETELIPSEGETKLLTGIVKDTSGAILPQASVKLVLDNLEITTEADGNGEWNMTVPATFTEGFVVANKIEYSKSIQRFIETENNVVKDIFLAKEESNTELNLGFVGADIKTLVGRLVGNDGTPMSYVTIFLLSLLDTPDIEYVFNGFVQTEADGTFEILYEDNNIASSTVHAYFSSACTGFPAFMVEGQDLFEDMGDLLLSTESFSIFETSLESDGSSCYETASTLVYNFNSGTGFLPVIWDQALGPVSLEYCPGEGGAFYIGVESHDNEHFNGLFLLGDEVEPSYAFDICTPNPGNFLELNIDGDVTLYSDVTFEATGIVGAENSESSLFFKVRDAAVFTPAGDDSSAYHRGEMTELEIVGANGSGSYSLDDDTSFNYVNIVQSDINFYAGLTQTRFLADNGTEVEITIRFRVGI